jgi:hypothetical protein
MSKNYAIVVPTIGKVAPLSQLFLFEPRHARYLTGLDKSIEPTTYQRAFLLPGILIVLCILLGLAQPDILPAVLVLVLFFALLGGVACWQVARTRYLCEHGKLIQGRIVDYDAGNRPHIGGAFGVMAYWESWGINALCGFRTPEGKVMSKRIRMTRRDLANQDIQDGTPIVVLYLNENRYKIL